MTIKKYIRKVSYFNLYLVIQLSIAFSSLLICIYRLSFQQVTYSTITYMIHIVSALIRVALKTGFSFLLSSFFFFLPTPLLYHTGCRSALLGLPEWLQPLFVFIFKLISTVKINLNYCIRKRQEYTYIKL